jgi:hypothetical protein
MPHNFRAPAASIPLPARMLILLWEQLPRTHAPINFIIAVDKK